MLETLNIIEVIVAVLLIAVILIQNKSTSLNLSSMSGDMGSKTKRGPEKVLHNATVILGTVFIVLALVLYVLS